MSHALTAIYEELRRLQQEGVDRVFIGESTLSLLAPAPKKAQPRAPAPTGGVSEDLNNLVEAGREEKTKHTAPAAKQKQEGKALPDSPLEIDLPEGDAATRMAWLRERVENCPTCNEHLSARGKVVFGTGSVEADIFFCGEAPGADEEVQGEPFVGKAGQLLT
ncbi:MAG: uracil-DNA glycosylase family protein, partial [Opitutales bacterium]